MKSSSFLPRHFKKCLSAAKRYSKLTLCLPDIRKAVGKWGWIRSFASHASGFVLGDTRAFSTTSSSVGLGVGCETALACCEKGPRAIPQHEAALCEAGQPLLRSPSALPLKATSCAITKLALGPGSWAPELLGAMQGSFYLLDRDLSSLPQTAGPSLRSLLFVVFRTASLSFMLSLI